MLASSIACSPSMKIEIPKLFYFIYSIEMNPLQEFYDGDTKPEVRVDGWNAWFCKDTDLVKSKWKYYGQNRQSVAELWIGFLVSLIALVDIFKNLLN
jgi:hypothetical protein